MKVLFLFCLLLIIGTVLADEAAAGATAQDESIPLKMKDNTAAVPPVDCGRMLDDDDDGILLKSDIEQVWFRPSWVTVFKLTEDLQWRATYRYTLTIFFRCLSCGYGVELRGKSSRVWRTQSNNC